MDVKDLQVVVTVGSCSSRIIVNVPKARSVGGELEFALAPTDNFDFSISGSYNDSTVRSTFPGTETQIEFTGIREGNRLPSVPKFQAAVAATYQQPIVPCLCYIGYLTGTYQHVGSRYTQLSDTELSGVPSLTTFGNTGIGGPFTQAAYTFDPLLPAYDILNLRLGVRHVPWDIAFYVNNVTDEKALLAIDRERDFRARFGYPHESAPDLRNREPFRLLTRRPWRLALTRAAAGSRGASSLPGDLVPGSGRGAGVSAK